MSLVSRYYVADDGEVVRGPNNWSGPLPIEEAPYIDIAVAKRPDGAVYTELRSETLPELERVIPDVLSDFWELIHELGYESVLHTAAPGARYLN